MARLRWFPSMSFLRIILLNLFICTNNGFLFTPFGSVKFPHSQSYSLHMADKEVYEEMLVKSAPDWKSMASKFGKAVLVAVVPLLLGGTVSWGDDELAKFAAEGNKVGVDTQCFFKKCALETSSCANDPNCLKGLSCLARCKGGSMCSTGCFAKYGSSRLDKLLSCSVEKNDCVQVPGKESSGWTMDKPSDLPTLPLAKFDIKDLDGKWYKVMGLDSRYDCFDCQKNTFKVKDSSTLSMEAMFRIPRPNPPGYLQNRIVEELKATDVSTGHISRLQSKGEMFGLTFWENWYVLSEQKASSASLRANINSLDMLGVPAVGAVPSSPATAAVEVSPDLKLIFYTGHTLQGSYKGAFLYSRTKEMTPGLLKAAAEVITSAGLNPNSFCVIHNQCFDNENEDEKKVNVGTGGAILPYASASTSSSSSTQSDGNDGREKDPFWYLGRRFFRVTEKVAEELADWFEDPAILSDWLVSQQEHMVFNQPLVR